MCGVVEGEPDEGALPPPPGLAGDLVVHQEDVAGGHAERVHVEEDLGLDDGVRIEAADHDHDVVAGLLGEDEDVAVRRVVEGQVAQLLQSGMLAADLVESPEQQVEVLATRFGAGPVARAVLELLGVQVLLPSPGQHLVLEQLEPGVHPPGGRQRGAEHGPDREGRLAAPLQEAGQDVGGVDEEVGPEERRGLGRELAQVLLDLPLLVAPGEVGVALVEADLAEHVHHRRLGEGLGQEEHVRVGPAHLGQQPGPEVHRLGVRVVHPEDPHTVRHPQPDDPQALGVDAVPVGVEVDRVDVLVLLRRVLRVRDRAVGAVGEPLRMVLHPRVVGGGLQGEVHRHLQAELVRPGHEPVEGVEVAEVGMDGVVPALDVADRPGRPGITGARLQGVVRALPERGADRVDRRQVDHVEAHRRRRLEPGVGGVERARDPLALRRCGAPPPSGGRTRTRRRTAPCVGRRRPGSPGSARSARVDRRRPSPRGPRVSGLRAAGPRPAAERPGRRPRRRAGRQRPGRRPPGPGARRRRTRRCPR